MESCATPGRSQPGERTMRRRQGRSAPCALPRCTIPESGMMLQCRILFSSQIEGTRSMAAARHAHLAGVLRTAVSGLRPLRLLRCLRLSKLKARVRPRSPLRTERQREKLCGRGPSRRAPGNAPMSGVHPRTPGRSGQGSAGPSSPAVLGIPATLGESRPTCFAPCGLGLDQSWAGLPSRRWVRPSRRLANKIAGVSGIPACQPINKIWSCAIRHHAKGAWVYARMEQLAR
jgi:hypothetical protein